MAQPQTTDQAPPDHWSASDEDASSLTTLGQAFERARANLPAGHVLTTRGPRPYFPDGPEPIQSDELTPDNPFNPRGGPSLSLPQQATPLTSLQDVLTLDEMDTSTPEKAKEYEGLMTLQDGLAPDDPRNPRGTPDYIVEEPSPQSNPLDEQHDGRTSHADTNPNPEAKRYWEDENPNAPASR